MTVETMLEEAFNAYLNLARAKLRPQQVTGVNPRRIQALETRHGILSLSEASIFMLTPT